MKLRKKVQKVGAYYLVKSQFSSGTHFHTFDMKLVGTN